MAAKVHAIYQGKYLAAPLNYYDTDRDCIHYLLKYNNNISREVLYDMRGQGNKPNYNKQDLGK